MEYIIKDLMNKTTLIVFLCLLLPLSLFNAQDGKDEDIRKVKAIIIKAERGIVLSQISDLTDNLSSKTYLSLLNGVSGYYGNNQSYYILKNYLNDFKPVNCAFDNVQVKENTAFASGNIKYLHNGIRGSSIVFITLQKQNEKWVITQITIN